MLFEEGHAELGVEERHYFCLLQHWVVVQIELEGSLQIGKTRRRVSVGLKASHVQRIKSIVDVAMPAELPNGRS